MKVGIFCSSSQEMGADYFKEMISLSKGLVQRKFEIVYGGSNEGLMQTLADSALKEGGKVTGIVPKYFKQQKHPVHENLSKLIVVEDLKERKEEFIKRSHVLVAFPGGIGTIDELIAVMSKRQLFEEPMRPLYMINFLNFWSPLIQFLKDLEEKKVIRRRSLKDLFKVVKNSEELFLELEKFKSFSSKRKIC